jgi:hypothetical protein
MFTPPGKLKNWKPDAPHGVATHHDARISDFHPPLTPWISGGCARIRGLWCRKNEKSLNGRFLEERTSRNSQ